MDEQVRLPAVAGMFYAGSPAALRGEIEDCYLDRRGPGALPQVAPDGPRRLVGLISPHAGYFYSGAIAAWGYAALARDGVPDTVVLIGPNHGRGSWVSAIQTEGVWRTPLGDVTIDEDLASAIASGLPFLRRDMSVFSGEHSLEVQLPFLQHLYGERLRIVPIMMLDQDERAAQAVGEALGHALAGKNVLLLASTDMTHQEPRERATAQDQLLTERVLALDAEGLLTERERRDITMCGYGPTAALIIAARALGATRAEVFRYGDSGEAESMARVVGYLSAGVYV